ncbi:ribonucleotide reductase small subunit [Mycena galopus ATCC 62051]|nr:ribonucleotide reductase small subunit [Mycena galopus ATCC 62051]
MANVQESQSFFLHLSKDLTTGTTSQWRRASLSSHVLAFFTASDGIVNETCSTISRMRCVYGFQIMLDNIPPRPTLCSSTEPTERDFLFDAIETIPCIKKKAEWLCGGWVYLRRAAGRLCSGRGISSPAIRLIFWMKKRDLMPGLTFSNELISRGEAFFACLLFTS